VSTTTPIKREGRVPRRRLWKCPTCGRRFAKVRQWHSCAARGVEDHFRGKGAAVRAIFDRLIQELRTIGPVRVDAVKTSINLINKHHFGGVRVRRNYLRVGFLANVPIHSPRIVHSESLGPGRVAQSVEIRSVEEIDHELLGWLAQAYGQQS
jgi:hypothetical protein